MSKLQGINVSTDQCTSSRFSSSPHGGTFFFQTNVKNIQNALKNLFDKNNSVFSCTEYRTILTYWPTEKSWLFLKKIARKLFAKIEKFPTLKSKKGPKTSKFDQIFTLKKIKMPEFGIKAKKRNRPEKGILFGAPKFSQLKSNYWICYTKCSSYKIFTPWKN